MNNFTFINPVKIHFGKGQIEACLPKEIKSYKKVMFCYGGGSIKNNGVYQQVIESLKGKEFVEFSGIESNPSYETLMQAVKIAKEESVDFILAVGGGSVIDGVKFIAAATYYKKGDPWEMLSKRERFSKALPLGTILTLPATGSEMNCYSVITRKSSLEKLAFGHKVMFPKFSILDPETMYSLPDNQISNGIADAFVHVLEQYITYPVDSPIQDRMAETLLITLIEEGQKVLKDRTNYNANANLMWAATMALNGLISAGVPEDWSTHAIGHELTALYGIDHAKTLAIVLPGTMKVLQKEKEEKLKQYGSRIWGIQDNVDEVINATEEFFKRLGIQTKLKYYGLGISAIDEVCKRLEVRGDIALGEHENISPNVVRLILESRL